MKLTPHLQLFWITVTGTSALLLVGRLLLADQHQHIIPKAAIAAFIFFATWLAVVGATGDDNDKEDAYDWAKPPHLRQESSDDDN